MKPIDSCMKFTPRNANADQAATLDLFGTVGGDFYDEGFSEEDILGKLNGLDPDEDLHVRVNSPGGSVYTALAVYNLLSEHKGKVTITVEGLAASAATIITSARNATVRMPKGSVMLIHPVRVSLYQHSKEELSEAAEGLEKIHSCVRDVYAAKTGLPAERIDELMGRETYLTAREAKDLGFADEIDESREVVNRMDGDFIDFNGLKAPKNLFAGMPSGFISAAVEENPAIQKEDLVMDLEKLKAEFPELVQQVEAAAKEEGARAERERISAINELAMPGVQALVDEAIVSGQSPAELAVAIVRKQKADLRNRKAMREADASELEAVKPQATAPALPGSEKAEADRKEELVAKAAARDLLFGNTGDK